MALGKRSVELLDWLIRPAPQKAPAARLFCFHPAGLGAAVFRGWSDAFPGDIEVSAVQLPGRANRFNETPISSIPVLAEHVVNALSEYLDVPFAFFGHSMGAVLAAEVARRLRSEGLPQPSRLIVSGRRPPHVPDVLPPLNDLPNDEFVAEINRRYGGIPTEFLNDPEILELFLPCLRADIAALESFRPENGHRLECPILACGGADDPLTPRAHLEAWRETTNAAVEVRVFPGGHFYLNMPTQRSALLAEISATLRQMLAPAGVQEYSE